MKSRDLKHFQEQQELSLKALQEVQRYLQDTKQRLTSNVKIKIEDFIIYR